MAGGSIEERILASGFARECAPSVESTIEMQRANQSATEILLSPLLERKVVEGLFLDIRLYRLSC